MQFDGERPVDGLSDKGKFLHGKLLGILRAPWKECPRSIVGTPYCMAGVATPQTVKPDVFRDLHEYYVEYSKIEPLGAVHILKRFLALTDYLQVAHTLFTANWLWEAGRRQLGASQVLRRAPQRTKAITEQMNWLLDEAEGHLRRGVTVFEEAMKSLKDGRPQVSFTDPQKKLLEAGLRTCLGFALRHKKSNDTEPAATWKRAAQMSLNDAPPGVAYFVGLANFARAVLEAKNGATPLWKSSITTAQKAFGQCSHLMLATLCQQLLAETNPASRADELLAVLDQNEAELGGEGPSPGPVMAQRIAEFPPTVAALKLMEQGRVAEALDAARAADRQIPDDVPDVTFLQRKVTLKVLEVQICCRMESWKAAEKACRDLHNATDKCAGHVEAHPLARANLIWRQLRAECYSRQSRPADALRMLLDAMPFAEATGGPQGSPVAALMVDIIICRLELHMTGQADMVEDLQKDMDRGVAALRRTQPPANAKQEMHERWAAETKLRPWLHVWRGLQAAAGDGLDVDDVQPFFDSLAERFPADRADEPMAAWQAAGRVLADDGSGIMSYIPWIRGMGMNLTTVMFTLAVLVPAAVGLFLVLYALQVI